MSVIERAKKHYENQEKLVISVPEWGDENGPLEVHVFPMTMAEISMMQRLASKKSTNIEQAANIIVVKARDKDGNRLFKLEERDDLMKNTDYQVVARIAEEIESRFFSNVENYKGNSEGTPSDSGK